MKLPGPDHRHQPVVDSAAGLLHRLDLPRPAQHELDLELAAEIKAILQQANKGGAPKRSQRVIQPGEL